jgi:hypothetical protein
MRVQWERNVPACTGISLSVYIPGYAAARYSYGVNRKHIKQNVKYSIQIPVPHGISIAVPLKEQQNTSSKNTCKKPAAGCTPVTGF